MKIIKLVSSVSRRWAQNAASAAHLRRRPPPLALPAPDPQDTRPEEKASDEKEARADETKVIVDTDGVDGSHPKVDPATHTTTPSASTSSPQHHTTAPVSPIREEGEDGVPAYTPRRRALLIGIQNYQSTDLAASEELTNPAITSSSTLSQSVSTSGSTDASQSTQGTTSSASTAPTSITPSPVSTSLNPTPTPLASKPTEATLSTPTQPLRSILKDTGPPPLPLTSRQDTLPASPQDTIHARLASPPGTATPLSALLPKASRAGRIIQQKAIAAAESLGNIGGTVADSLGSLNRMVSAKKRKKKKKNKAGEKKQGEPNPNMLKGCHKDVLDMKQLLIDLYGFKLDEITCLLDNNDPTTLEPTADNIISSIEAFVDGARSGDNLFFFYAGHSTQVETDSKDEEDGMDELIVTCDNKMIKDDQLKELLVDPLPAGCFLTAVFDSCHSASLLDLEHFRCNRVYVPWINKGRRRSLTRWNWLVRRAAAPLSPLRNRSPAAGKYPHPPNITNLKFEEPQSPKTPNRARGRNPLRRSRRFSRMPTPPAFGGVDGPPTVSAHPVSPFAQPTPLGDVGSFSSTPEAPFGVSINPHNHPPPTPPVAARLSRRATPASTGRWRQSSIDQIMLSSGIFGSRRGSRADSLGGVAASPATPAAGGVVVDVPARQAGVMVEEPRPLEAAPAPSAGSAGPTDESRPPLSTIAPPLSISHSRSGSSVNEKMKSLPRLQTGSLSRGGLGASLGPAGPSRSGTLAPSKLGQEVDSPATYTAAQDLASTPAANPPSTTTAQPQPLKRQSTAKASTGTVARSDISHHSDDSGVFWLSSVETGSGGGFSKIERCLSPEPLFCTGFCALRPYPADKPFVFSLSAAKDGQVAWEDANGASMTQALIKLLRKTPNPTLYDLLVSISHDLHSTYLHLHAQARDYKKRARQVNAERRLVGKEERPIRQVEMDNFQNPQISSLYPLNTREERWMGSLVRADTKPPTVTPTELTTTPTTH